MRRAKLVRLVVAFAVAVPLLAACTDFDPDKLDFFHINEKKKLPGERKPLFPEGVPGVSNGVPPDLVKGYQPPPQAAEVEPPKTEEAEKPKPKLKPRVAKQAIPGPPATRITVQPGQSPQQPGQQAAPAQQPPPQQAQSPWPAPQQPAQPSGAQSPWPATTQQTSPWPAPPPSGTFQR
jgi:hypothetical protein